MIVPIIPTKKSNIHKIIQIESPIPSDRKFKMIQARCWSHSSQRLKEEERKNKMLKKSEKKEGKEKIKTYEYDKIKQFS